MTSEIQADSVRETNVSVSKELMSDFDIDGVWADLMHDDVVLEFPFGPCIGMPGVITGKKDSIEYLHGIETILPDLTFRDVVVTPTTDPARVIVEYNGETTTMTGNPYSMSYITVQEFKDGKMSLFREFYNPTVAMRDLGDCIGEDGSE